MPRPASKTHVLRTTRKILGLSQADLGKKVGLSSETIKRIENHSLAMSKDAASRIAAYTGVNKEQLLQNSGPTKPQNRWGEPFSKTWFENDHHTAEVTKETIDYYIRFIVFQVQMALDACSSVQPKAVHSLIGAIVSAVADLTDRYKLRAEVGRLTEKFFVLKADDPFAREKLSAEYVSPTIREKYYAELAEGRRIIKTRQKGQGASKPRRRSP